MHRPLTLADQALLGSMGSGLFDPNSITGLVRWYKSETFNGLGYSDTDEITDNWVDNSVSADDAVPGGTAKPQFRNSILTTSPGISVQFDSTNLRHFDFSGLTLGDFSVVTFWKPTADAILLFGAPNHQVRERSAADTQDRPYLYPSAAPELQHIGSEDANEWHVRTWTRNGTSGVPLFYFNKTQSSEDSSFTNATTHNMSVIGLDVAGPTTFNVVEILIYNTILSQTDVNNLYDGYFAVKYSADL